jgi:hypothetical protein
MDAMSKFIEVRPERRDVVDANEQTHSVLLLSNMQSPRLAWPHAR